MSVQIKIDGAELAKHQRLLSVLSDPAHSAALLDVIGAVHASQVRRRIQTEKTAPDGSPWAPWSASYGNTRHGNQSLLQSGGGLLDSIGYSVNKKTAQVGSALAYAKTPQEGFDGIVSVPAHVRRISQAFGKVLKFPVNVNVSAFKRHLIIPKREFLGLSDSNQKEMLNVIGQFWQEKMQ